MDQSFLSLIFQSLLALAAVLGLFALMVWGMRRFQQRLPGWQPQSRQDFRIHRRLNLDGKSCLIEISHEGRRYLLGLSAQGIFQIDPHASLPGPAKPTTQPADEPGSGEAS